MVDYGLEKKSASKMAGKEIVRSGRYACAAEAKTARAAESKEGRRWEGKGGGPLRALAKVQRARVRVSSSKTINTRLSGSLSALWDAGAVGSD